MPSYKFFVGLAVLAYLVAMLVVRSRRPKIPVWSIMAFSAFAVVATALEPVDAISSAIDLNVILFLVGFFSVVGLAESSGLLDAIAYWVLSRARSLYGLLYASSVLFGLMAAFMVNDTVALMGPPIAYTMARTAGVDPRAMFLLLAFSLTVGSAMTPMGNPQNMLIAIRSGMKAPLISFVSRLALPTAVNLLLTTYVIIKAYGIRNRPVSLLLIPHEAIRNRRDAALAGAGLVACVGGLVANDALALAGLPHIAQRGFLPFMTAAAIYIFASEPRKVLAHVDWGTIVFFMTMFITMDGVWRSGVVQAMLGLLHPAKMDGALEFAAISASSILLSQLLSNVPFVDVYIEYLKALGYGGRDVAAWVTLAATSTIAGNLTILGAASNVIILEVLESRYNTTITFTEFVKVGAVVTAVNTLVYSAFLVL
ncbi:MAG: SLC13 family permease [Desulfurococcaceae archaeon]